MDQTAFVGGIAAGVVIGLVLAVGAWGIYAIIYDFGREAGRRERKKE